MPNQSSQTPRTQQGGQQGHIDKKPAAADKSASQSMPDKSSNAAKDCGC